MGLKHTSQWLVLAATLMSWGSFSYAQDGNQSSTNQPATESSEQVPADEPFWPAWNNFVKDITESSVDNNPDPWEGWNRKAFAFNDRADRYFLKPVAKGYQWITPGFVETGIGNVFSNFFEVTTIVNDVLQWKLSQAASDTGRFVVNTTVGIGGIFDVASKIGLEKHNEDFGQTLGHWGVGSGPYLVVPLLGSYTLRSGTGTIIQTNGTGIINRIEHVRTRNTALGVRFVHNRASLFQAEGLITGDRYAFVRDAYLQRREFLAKDGIVEDSFGDEDFDDWGSDEL